MKVRGPTRFGGAAHTFDVELLDQPYTVRVEWTRAWRGRGEPSPPNPDEWPWYVTFRLNGQHLFSRWVQTIVDPSDLWAWSWMEEQIEAFDLPAPPPPRRRGLLAYLLNATRMWLDEGT